MNRSYKILVAEDNELMLDLLTAELQEVLGDIQLTQATDGLEAMRQSMSHPFDLIVTDNVMPGMLGSKVLREIRAGNGPNQHTPCIFCSGNFSVEEIKGIKNCLLLQKPFDIRKFHAFLFQLFPPEGATLRDEEPKAFPDNRP